ncbi:MAG: endonuclease VIII [Clostridiaceae bacterium]|nr:endonuclease VIII [Clostridiaceae bacterium]
MIERPESFVLARQIGQALTGRTIRQVVAQQTAHKFAWFSGDPADYPSRLAGRRIVGAASFGGFVAIEAEGMRLVFGDGVNLRCWAPGQALPQRHQLLLGFDNGSSLTGTVQMYGGLWAFRDGENDNPYIQTALEKPDPLGDSFDLGYFGTLWAPEDEKLSLKAFLATRQRIPGLGNGVLQDILFAAGQHPKTRLVLLDAAERASLYWAIRQTLRAMADGGGRDTEKDLFGAPGGYPTQMSAKRKGLPCRVCGSPIVQEAYLGGSDTYCPSCQRQRK